MKITFIADLHHYSKKLGVTGKAFELRSGSDQKCLAETGDIIDAAFEEIGNSDTDVVFILGDVSNDGEMLSHYELRDKLYELKKKKNVYLITATHDWCCDGNPRSFNGDEVSNDVDVMNSCDLPDFYKDFGPSQSSDSFITKIGTICYVIELSDHIRVLCLNDDKDENNNAGFTDECWQWIEKQINKAKEDGCLMIGIEHHLLMPHISPLIAGGSVCVASHEKIATRFANLGLKYMFVGHSHLEATDKFTTHVGNSITEVNVGSLVGYPAPIVNVIVNEDDTLTYTVEHLKQFKMNNQTIDAQAYLKKHSVNVINRVLECKTMNDFVDRLSALGLDKKKAFALWPIVKPILNKLNTMLTWDLYKLLLHLGLITKKVKESAEAYHYKSVRDFIDEMWIAALDGSVVTHDRESNYYKLVMAVYSVPSKMFKDSDIADQIIEAADYILTGGDINNQHATI